MLLGEDDLKVFFQNMQRASKDIRKAVSMQLNKATRIGNRSS